MKEKIISVRKGAVVAAFIFSAITASAQTAMDTVKPGKANDPMNVNPGKANDKMAVKPLKPNDGMSLMTDTGFVTKNINDNREEIALSKLGREKGTLPAVKNAAEIMITDHTAMLRELEKFAAKKGIAVRSMPNQMPHTNLTGGKDFDQQWAAQMLKMHEAKIAALEHFISLTKDAELKNIVLKALPKIKSHRALLMKIPGAKEKTNVSPEV